MNVNDFLFNAAEYADRKNRRFKSRKSEYKQIKSMIKEIGEM